jgi:hypothetical protein
MTANVTERHIASLLFIEQRRTLRLLKILSVTIAILLLVALFLSAGLALTKQMPLFYTVSEETVTVTAGSTLWGIAGEYLGEYPGSIRAYVAEICRANDLTYANVLPVGIELVIPIYHYKFG